MAASLTRLRRGGVATVADAWASLDAHGLTGGDPDARVLGGFTLIGGSGDCPPQNTLCSIAGLKAGVLVVAELGARGSSLLAYEDLLGLEVGGHGVITTGQRYAGGGIGLGGIVTGMALGAMLSAASEKTLIDSFIRITSRSTEMVLCHRRYTPGTVRNGLSMMFVRFQTAQQERFLGGAGAAVGSAARGEVVTPGEEREAEAGAVDELERLTRLHAAGTLTDMEFEAARARHIRRLTE